MSTSAAAHLWVARAADLYPRIHLSIRAKILLSLSFVILLMGTINALLLSQALTVSRQYDAIITNVATANSISSVKTDIDAAMWGIVAGNTLVDAGKQYAIINDVNAKLRQMQSNTDLPRAKIKLDVITRAMQTLSDHVNRLGDQVKRRSTAAANEAMLEDVRFDSSVVEDLVHDYALFEVQRTEQQYEQIRDGLSRWAIFYVVLTLSAVAFVVIATWRISESIAVSAGVGVGAAYWQPATTSAIAAPRTARIGETFMRGVPSSLLEIKIDRAMQRSHNSILIRVP